ncbi:hypothetical protein LR48_Vigan01g139300 [Vigna angularis]|uniref:Uncharacterized protein n=1 Tax=Phaseolus angularis TaxID=3914 RepID=A0A0L9TMZ8_PHAAN|nr:hypothetical protein LR48_Vigan01g139300 [Vigna angularis]
MEWYLRKEDRHRPEIRAAFNMDDGGMSEGSKVEKDDDDDESSDDGTWEAGAEERLRKNNDDIRALNAKIGVLTRELFEICQTPIFHEADACGTDEEVGGGVDEAPGVGGEEKAEVGGDEEAEVRPDCGFEEEGDGNAVQYPLGAYTEVRGEDKTAHEEEIVSRTVDNIHFIEIDDDGDEEEREVVPLVIPPLRSFVGDPSTTVDVDQLYTTVSVREMTVYRHDCGVIMLKAMEIWDGDEKYNGKSMPEYTTEELLGIRKKYVCDWILDNENIRRIEALQCLSARIGWLVVSCEAKEFGVTPHELEEQGLQGMSEGVEKWVWCLSARIGLLVVSCEAKEFGVTPHELEDQGLQGMSGGVEKRVW